MTEVWNSSARAPRAVWPLLRLKNRIIKGLHQDIDEQISRLSWNDEPLDRSNYAEFVANRSLLPPKHRSRQISYWVMVAIIFGFPIAAVVIVTL